MPELKKILSKLFDINSIYGSGEDYLRQASTSTIVPSLFRGIPTIISTKRHAFIITGAYIINTYPYAIAYFEIYDPAFQTTFTCQIEKGVPIITDNKFKRLGQFDSALTPITHETGNIEKLKVFSH